MHVSLSFAKVVGSKVQISLKSEWNYSVKSVVLHSTEPALISVLLVDSFKKIGDIERIGYK
jgi:hypothetical protein